MSEATYAFLISVIGYSHALQPPLTTLLAKRLGFKSAFAALAEMPALIAQNMGFASVAMPTVLGIWLGWYAEQALASGSTRTLAFLLAAFWCWRLFRQLGPLRRAWGPAHRGWIWGLALIFVVQGPLLLLLLVLGRQR